MLAVLREWAPDCVLIECPEDAGPALPLAAWPAMSPPVALLLYDPADYREATHLPLAAFSPEWLALRYALFHQVPCRPMDLPFGARFPQDDVNTSAGESDPFALLAAQMGYADSERWWDYFFEQTESREDLFDTLGNLLAALRPHDAYTQTQENRLREAWMRRVIRRAVSDGFRKIAVVTGAFHVPALRTWKEDEPSDESLLRPLSIHPVQSTWVPWTYGQLALSSGYGAGMISPAWYDMLYEHSDSAPEHWMVRCGTLLRHKGVEVPPSSVADAVEMARSLAVIRQMTRPGLDELEEAALAVLARGDTQWLLPIREELRTGDRMGKVAPEVPLTPLQADFEKQLKGARLSRARQTPGRIRQELDLRKPTNRNASILLHRLFLLDIPWGTLQSAGELVKGSFREQWRLEWKAGFTIRMLECGAWGLTIEEAAARYALRDKEGPSDPGALACRLLMAVRAGLPDTAKALARRLQDDTAGHVGVWPLAGSLSPLIQVARYGESYSEALPDLNPLLDHLVPRVLIGLPQATLSLGKEELSSFPGRIRQLLADLRQYGQSVWTLLFWQQVLPLTDSDRIAPFAHGFLSRFACEEGELDPSELTVIIRQQLNAQRTPAHTAEWTAGLLSGSEQLLIRQPTLWETLAIWVENLPPETFRQVLPILRKGFSVFSEQGRRHIAHRVKKKAPEVRPEASPGMDVTLTQAQTGLLLPALQRFLRRS